LNYTHVLNCIEEREMFASSPEHAVEMMDKAFNEGDLESLLGFYEEAAVVVTEPGKLARGKPELRRFLEHVMSSRPTARQLKTHVIEADGIALFLSRWTLATSGEASSKKFVATTVFRRQPNGEWKALIDNSLGPLVLDPE
jgi:ketosteroid isomerase-like protein